MTIKEFDYSVDVLKAILWQYNEAEKLQSILQSKQDWYNTNQEQFWMDWYNNVFNLATANDFGLSVWAKILDVSFALPQQPVRNNDVWGFGPFNENFTNGNFSPTGGDDTSLTIEQKRSILQLTYLKYVSRGTVPEINKVLTTFFGFKVYILDGFDMTGTVVFTQQVPIDTLSALEMYDLIPRPAGVEIKTTVVTGNEFGFDPNGMNFYDGFFGA